MKAERRAARDFVKGINTKAELDDYLNMLNLTDEERTIARMMFGNGWTRAKIALETGYSEPQIKRKIRKIYDRMI